MPKWIPATLALLSLASPAHSFCGFYVASGQAQLFNHRSQVVLARDGDRTALTMASDYQGDPKQFAVVVPVPTVLDSSQVHVGDGALVERIDAYSAPRLVEYWDPDPCPRAIKAFNQAGATLSMEEISTDTRQSISAERLVTVEAKFSVGEYDILILSATESAGLARWLVGHGYRIPRAAEPVLASYLKQGMKFFVAKVNLGAQRRLGVTKLRPLQLAYESSRFMLPIRLGMANANGPQELFVYTLTKTGRVECTNYRTLELPTGEDVPEFVKSDWGEVYPALFAHQADQGHDAVFTEYAWNMSWCDPCAAPPLSADELRGLGVWWAGDAPSPQVYLTRLHVRYDRAHFPEDLVFQQTADQRQYQARYVMRHRFQGDTSCPAGQAYLRQLAERRRQEVTNLAALTGWSEDRVAARVPATPAVSQTATAHWWQKLWK